LTIAKDSITIVHFYAHWCGPCMRELPEIAEFQDIYQKAGISIICVTDDAFEFVEDFKNRSQLKILRTPSLKDINVFSIPMTYIYNQKGEQVQRIEGPFEWSNPNTLTEILKYKQS
jgi:thiol-disulfide isomerase/thioredoxin